MPSPFEDFVLGGDDTARPARLPDPAPIVPRAAAPDATSGRDDEPTGPEMPTAPARTKTPKKRKWRGPLIAAGLAVGFLITNAPQNLTPSRPMVQRMEERLSAGKAEARPYNAVEAAFTKSMKEAVNGLSAVGKRPNESLIHQSLCTFSPDAITRTQKKMKSHMYRYALSSARADLLARCGDTPGLIRLHQELRAIQYPDAGSPVEFLALRERVARTIANTPSESARKGRWVKEAEAAKTERLERPLRASRNIETEALDAWHLRDSYNTELAHAHDTFGRGARESHGYAMMMRPTVQASQALAAKGPTPR